MRARDLNMFLNFPTPLEDIVGLSLRSFLPPPEGIEQSSPYCCYSYKIGPALIGWLPKPGALYFFKAPLPSPGSPRWFGSDFGVHAVLTTLLCFKPPLFLFLVRLYGKTFALPPTVSLF